MKIHNKIILMIKNPNLQLNKKTVLENKKKIRRIKDKIIKARIELKI